MPVLKATSDHSQNILALHISNCLSKTVNITRHLCEKRDGNIQGAQSSSYIARSSHLLVYFRLVFNMLESVLVPFRKIERQANLSSDTYIFVLAFVSHPGHALSQYPNEPTLFQQTRYNSIRGEGFESILSVCADLLPTDRTSSIRSPIGLYFSTFRSPLCNTLLISFQLEFSSCISSLVNTPRVAFVLYA